MKLKIKETAWGIHRMAWGYRERVTAEESFPCEVGDVPDFGKGKRHFTVDEVTENEWYEGFFVAKLRKKAKK